MWSAYSNKGRHVTITHHIQTHKCKWYTAPLHVRKRLFASINSLLWLPEYATIMLALEGLFPPQLACHQGHCAVLSGSEPKWDPFRGIFRYFHERMERIFISYFFFFYCWLNKALENTHTATSYTDQNHCVKRIPASSNFPILLPKNLISLLVFFISQKQLLHTLWYECPVEVYTHFWSSECQLKLPTKDQNDKYDFQETIT